MSKPPMADVPWRLLDDLRRLVAERTPADVEIPAEFAARNEAVNKRHQQTWEKLVKEYEEQKRAVETEYASARGAIVAEFGTNHEATQREYDEVRREILGRFRAAEKDQEKELQEAHWEATTVFEATKDGPDIQRKAIEEQLAAGQGEFVAVAQDVVELLRRRWQWRDYADPDVDSLPPEGTLARFAELVALARDQWRGLHYQRIPAMFEGGWPLGFLVLLWLAMAYPAGAALGWTNWYWIAASGSAALVLWLALGSWLYAVAKRQTSRAYIALRQTLLEADLVRRTALKTARAECERKRAEIVKRLHDELKTADNAFSSCSDELKRRKQSDVQRIEEKYPLLLTELAARRDSELKDAKAQYARRLREVEADYADQSARVLDRFSRELRQSKQRFDRQWGEMSERWRSGIQQFQSDVNRINRDCRALFPEWIDPRWADWGPPGEVPPVLPFGRFETDLHDIDGAMPEDESLRPPQSAFSLPAMFAFGQRSLFMLKTSGAGRDGAVAAIQALMLRMLTSIPPGKVRFTIIDPVGLGENFSAFMHLADYDEQLVSNRIWTEGGHIDQRLADLTEHMENVIQAYLRNEFDSIQEYNEFAGEMAEPYRVLVIANFPANFSESAARRLASIVASGARCGVYTVLSVDTALQLPRDFDLADLEARAISLNWEDGSFVWLYPGYGKEPVVLDGPPPAEQFTTLVRTVAGRLEDVARVEVPFECVVPDREAWWTADSRGGVDVPLGRAGALKLQHLQLGKGTSQHVLIAGRTGSGKSTLLHALITNVALHYSPDEIELYLIDFKKGVEFKAFATFELPHARVIAIESEREFGLSVLERLDEELKKRGDLFREHGVQDVRGFRSAMPDARMPRVLLIVDEFQELFVEDDRIAQTAALLLDRLVRQGRAFGIHVLLGSQTLAGAYSLPRSTIGQMAVRIALQCSEADAHLILSEENTAARLLTRPGEAIYNDANGLFEGNHPFQVVWLSDEQREAYLNRIRQMAAERGCAVEPAIVFEGNAPADPGQNPFLRKVLEAPSWDGAPGAARAWLGASIAIKSPTAAQFSRQSGSNLLIVGHREEEALGVLATSLIALAAQGRPADPAGQRPGASFYVFDGTRPDAPEVGFWNRLAPAVPHSVQVVRPRDAQASIANIAEELARRQEAGDEEGWPIYLVIYNLVRFRELRKAEDDFSFSRTDEDKPPDPAAQFSNILREGPALGIHTLVWCDTFNTVNRWLDRQSLRDLEMRVLFQMNASDSSSLIDSPAASRLGIHRAVLYSEEQGRLEKFRPYGVPSDAWLEWVKERLHGRAPGGRAQQSDAAIKEGSSSERS